MREPRIVIIVEGGIVQAVVSDGRTLPYIVLDFDVTSDEPVNAYTARTELIDNADTYIQDQLADR